MLENQNRYVGCSEDQRVFATLNITRLGTWFGHLSLFVFILGGQVHFLVKLNFFVCFHFRVVFIFELQSFLRPWSFIGGYTWQLAGKHQPNPGTDVLSFNVVYTEKLVSPKLHLVVLPFHPDEMNLVEVSPTKHRSRIYFVLWTCFYQMLGCKQSRELKFGTNTHQTNLIKIA